MTDPRAFISFDADHDADQKVLFAGQAKLSKTPFNIQDWSSKAALPEAEWERQIEAKIHQCNMLIVLVGNSMGSASGVVKEIGFARRGNVPVFGVYVNGAKAGCTLPGGLQSDCVIAWEWDTIAKAISQMMGEGKNKK